MIMSSSTSNTTLSPESCQCWNSTREQHGLRSWTALQLATAAPATSSTSPMRFMSIKTSRLDFIAVFKNDSIYLSSVRATAATWLGGSADWLSSARTATSSCQDATTPLHQGRHLLSTRRLCKVNGYPFGDQRPTCENGLFSWFSRLLDSCLTWGLLAQSSTRGNLCIRVKGLHIKDWGFRHWINRPRILILLDWSQSKNQNLISSEIRKLRLCNFWKLHSQIHIYKKITSTCSTSRKIFRIFNLYSQKKKLCNYMF